MDNSIIVSMEYNDTLWEALINSIDDDGGIDIGMGVRIYVLPKNEADFIIETTEVIRIAINLGTEVAVGLFTSWLYDSLKEYKQSKVFINDRKIDKCEKTNINEIIKEIIGGKRKIESGQDKRGK